MADEDKNIGAGAGAGPATVNGYTIDPGNPNFQGAVTAAKNLNGIDFTSQGACAPVQAFQNAWNAAGGAPTLTVDGGYGQNTVNANAAVAQANGDMGGVPGPASSFPNCSGGVTPPNPPPAPPVTPPGGMKTWVKVLLWALVAGGVAGTGYLLYRWMQKKSGAAEPRRRKRGRRKK